MQSDLPHPDAIAQQHSDSLLEIIKSEINQAGGSISFADYMQLCLYQPGLGYYSAGSYKFGSGGDFITAPLVSSLFSRALAHHIADVFDQLTDKNVVEFGAGTGVMAADILVELQSLNQLPQYYYIIEASADLQKRQEETIKSAIPELLDKVVWLADLPSNFEGVMLANEVCDAMPVHRLHFVNGDIREQHIGVADNQLQWCEQAISNHELKQRAKEISPLIGEADYYTEINLVAPGWINTLSASLKRGAIFIIDYGYTQSLYYQPERAQGTLMCYYQHQAHDNPLFLPGLQDITAHVDFTALAQAALASAMNVSGFHAQADFLIAGNIAELHQSQLVDLDEWQQQQQVMALKRLLMPDQMGESFKVLSLTRELEPLPRLVSADRRYSL